MKPLGGRPKKRAEGDPAALHLTGESLKSFAGEEAPVAGTSPSLGINSEPRSPAAAGRGGRSGPKNLQIIMKGDTLAMKRNHLFEPLTQLAAGLAFLHLWVVPIYGQNAHELFTDVLRSHVQDGVVNYGALCNDQRLNDYIGHLESINPADFQDRARKLAFWINAYNAFTLKVVCDNYPIQSINDLHRGGLYIGILLKTTVWDRKFIWIGGRRLSLNDIEHKIIRPVFGDPRIHFALVCAAISCPPLRSEAFEATKLDEQLDDQGRIFLSEAAKNRFDLASKTAHLSKILDWYGDDFGKNDAQLLTYIARFLPAEITKQVLSNPEEWNIKHTDYDWGLNDLTAPSAEGRFRPAANASH